MYARKIILLFIVFFLLSCQKEEKSEASIDARLQEYFENFEEEGQKRNIPVDFDITQIEGYLAEIPDQGVVGQCYHRTENPNQILIDVHYWQNANETRREFTVFHELGHCFLNRVHLDSTNEEGICTSIMHSGQVCSDNYNDLTKEKYLDELFGY